MWWFVTKARLDRLVAQHFEAFSDKMLKTDEAQEKCYDGLPIYDQKKKCPGCGAQPARVKFRRDDKCGWRGYVEAECDNCQSRFQCRPMSAKKTKPKKPLAKAKKK